MLIIIVVLLCMLMATLILVGPTGRFMLVTNAVGPKTILLLQEANNRLKWTRVQMKGNDVEIKKKNHMFYVDQVRGLDASPQANTPGNPGNPNPKPAKVNPTYFNDALKKPSHLDGKIVLFGSEAAGAVWNPSVNQMAAESSVRDKLKLVIPYSIQDIYQLINTVLVPQRAENIWMDGENSGLNRYRSREQVLLAVIIILTIALVAMAYFVVK